MYIYFLAWHLAVNAVYLDFAAIESFYSIDSDK